MGRDRNRNNTIEFNYGSLLDIISNVLGIIIFLAVIIMLLPSSTKEKAIEIINISKEEKMYLNKRMPVIVDIPWSRMEDYDNIVLAIIYDEHAIYIDFESLYQRLKEQSRDTFYFEKDIDNLYRISTLPVKSGDAKNAWFAFSPPSDHSDQKKYKSLDAVLSQLNPLKTRIVFFVYPSGHGKFYELYYNYRDLGFNISWFAVPGEDERHYIGYSYDGTKVQAE